jgi:hypothetical protein
LSLGLALTDHHKSWANRLWVPRANQVNAAMLWPQAIGSISWIWIENGDAENQTAAFFLRGAGPMRDWAMRIFGFSAAAGTGGGARSICIRFRTAALDMSGSFGMALFTASRGKLREPDARRAVVVTQALA